MLLSAPSLWAQKTVIQGRVVDKPTGEPLPGVNVIVTGTYKGAATDMDGRFKITGLAPGDYNIKASMIGYTVQLQTGIKVRLIVKNPVINAMPAVERMFIFFIFITNPLSSVYTALIKRNPGSV